MTALEIRIGLLKVGGKKECCRSSKEQNWKMPKIISMNSKIDSKNLSEFGGQ